MQLMLAITNRCNKSCAHCCFSSSPEDNRGLSLEEMCHYIDQAASITGAASEKEILDVRFTGGEPFLRYDDLLEAVGYAKKQGAKRIGCTTNGYWAASLREAQEKMAALKSAGLSNIRFSCDEFHESLEGIESLRNAFIAAVEAEIPMGLKIVVYHGSLRASDILRLMEDVTKDIIFYIEELLLLPVGRAGELPENMFIKSKDLPANTWCDLLKTIVVEVDKNVYPCCSPVRPGLLHLGNLDNTPGKSLADLIDKANKNPLFNALARKGPVFFIPFLEKAGLVFPPGTYINRCHLCQDVLKAADNSERAKECLQEAVSAWENEQSWMHTVLETVQQFLDSSQ
ncbi:MAG: radical SAM protein [Candidatus Aminicenantes bacterium]|nr:radical SAM protein [Candidatus Aminicenantes bacterium]NIM77287.1 radical SAM protein [Candidatus Aminicenantes bacterium]NIN16588.1 radical SAM protein [Candidatus Aminicenantes bacterium]NIN40446.1 radical SAM protein [Candidatus Aminicenantes bacterium]NIN83266.1 radical SAM protein [Candidatus Aminicenantes bacterium]